MNKLNVKLKSNFHKDFLVTLKGNQFLKDEFNTVDLNDREVQCFLDRYEEYIIIEKEDTPESTPEVVKKPEKSKRNRMKAKEQKKKNDNDEELNETFLNEGEVTESIKDEVILK